MLSGRRTIRLLPKLVRIRRRRYDVRKQARDRDRQEKNDGCCACPLHASLTRKVLPIISEAELAASVTKVTIIVRFTSNATSRPRAAFHASWPIPGMSHRASMGIAAVNAK